MRRLVGVGGAIGGMIGATVLAIAAFIAVAAGATPSTDATAAVSCEVKAAQKVASASAPIHVTTGSLPTLSDSQARNARAIVAQGIADRFPRDGLIIGIMTAMQESTLTNIGYGDTAGPDSRGLFQQRAPWGPLSVRMDPAGAAHMFFTGGQGGQRGLRDINGWQSMPKTLAAQAVQVSAFPLAYAKWESAATRIVDAILAGTKIDPGPAPAPTPAPKPVTCEIPKPKPVKTACNAPTDLSNYGNGRIPLDKLCPIPWAKGQYLRSDAAAALIDLDKQFRAAFGKDICITEAYRTYAEEVRLYRIKPPGFAARPGTSNHGWAHAADLCGGIQSDGTPEHVWMLAHAPAAGWVSPPWARPGAGGPYEPWHWEYGTSGGGK